MTWPTGPKHPKAKLTTDMVKLLRKFRDQGMSYSMLGMVGQCSMWTARGHRDIRDEDIGMSNAERVMQFNGERK